MYVTGFQMEKAQVVHTSSESYREEIVKGCEDITKSAKLDPPKPTPRMWIETSSLHPQMLLGQSIAVTHNQQWEGERHRKIAWIHREENIFQWGTRLRNYFKAVIKFASRDTELLTHCTFRREVKRRNLFSELMERERKGRSVIRHWIKLI